MYLFVSPLRDDGIVARPGHPRPLVVRRVRVDGREPDPDDAGTGARAAPTCTVSPTCTCSGRASAGASVISFAARGARPERVTTRVVPFKGLIVNAVTASPVDRDHRDRILVQGRDVGIALHGLDHLRDRPARSGPRSPRPGTAARTTSRSRVPWSSPARNVSTPTTPSTPTIAPMIAGRTGTAVRPRPALQRELRTEHDRDAAHRIGARRSRSATEPLAAAPLARGARTRRRSRATPTTRTIAAATTTRAEDGPVRAEPG